MVKVLPSNIDNSSNAIDGMRYGDLYAFATVFFGIENAYKVENKLNSYDIAKICHRIRGLRSGKHHLETQEEFEFFGISREVSKFYQLLEKFGYDGNPYMLIELENSFDNIVLNKVLEYIKNLNRFNDDITFKSKFFLEKEKYVPSYEYFSKHFTKKIDNIIDDMVLFFQNKLINSNKKFDEKPKNNLQEIKISRDRIFINFECTYISKIDQNYYNAYYNSFMCYTIEKAKIDDASIKILYNFLIDLGFPYQKNFNEYIRFLKNLDMKQYILLNNYVSDKDKDFFPNYYYDLTRFFKMFIPSPIKPKQFLNHTHIVGRSGSGKSELLKTIIKQVGESCILLDPHGDIADSLDKKQNFFKIAPTENRFVINPFDIEDKSIDNRELVSEEIIQLLQEIIQDSNVSVLMKTISFPIISTLLKLPYADFRMLADCINPISGIEHLERLTPLVDDHLKHIWNDLKTDTYDTTKRSIFNRLQSFLNKHKIVSTVCGYDDFNNAIKRVEQGENLVISLPIPQLGEDVSEVLGRFFMCRLQIWAKRRQTLAEKDRKPVLLIVDECQNYLSEETARTLDQFGRKFGLYMVLAHQHIAQIDGKGLKGSMLANCKNKIVGYCDESTAKPMGNAIGVSYEEFTELKKGHWWGLFEDQKPLKFYARLAKFKTVSEAVNYAQSQNTDFLDGWGLVQDEMKNPTKTTPKTPKFTAKFDL